MNIVSKASAHVHIGFWGQFWIIYCCLSQPRFSNSTGSKMAVSRFWYLAESILSSICPLFAVPSTDAIQTTTSTSWKGVSSTNSTIYLLSKHIFYKRDKSLSRCFFTDFYHFFLNTGKYGPWGTMHKLFSPVTSIWKYVLPLCRTDVQIYQRLLSVCWNLFLHQLLPCTVLNDNQNSGKKN